MVLFLFIFIGLVWWEVLEGTVIYDNFGGLVAVAHIWSAVLTLLHYAVPLLRRTPHVHHGSLLLDLWLGIDLNPRIFGVDLKTFAYRPPMLGYVLINISLAAQQIGMLSWKGKCGTWVGRMG